VNRPNRLWYAFCQQILRVLLIVFFGLRVYHRRRVPSTGGVLVVANHQSYLDPILTQVGVRRRFDPMARESLFRFAPFRWLIRSLGAFPVRRASADLGAIREAMRRLKAGRCVQMFPEGTRTRDGTIGHLAAGPATIAARSRVPILPVVVDGAFEAWPRTRRFPRRHPVRVAYGEPIPAAEVASRPPEKTMAEVRRRMIELQAELRVGAAPARDDAP